MITPPSDKQVSDKDIVKVAHELLSQHSRVHALNDSDPDKDVDVAWVISALADEVERLRGICDVAIKGVGAPIMHNLAQEALRQLRTVRPKD